MRIWVGKGVEMTAEEFCTKHVRAISWGCRVLGTGLVGYAVWLCIKGVIFLTRHDFDIWHDFWHVWLIMLAAILFDFAGNVMFILGGAVVKVVRGEDMIKPGISPGLKKQQRDLLKTRKKITDLYVKAWDLENALKGVCDHSSSKEYRWEHDNGYGRQTMISGRICVYCRAIDPWGRGDFHKEGD